MAGSAFDVEQLRLAAARRLPAACHDDFLRLSRTLVHGPAFQWLLVDAPDEGLRKQVMAALDEVLSAAGLPTNRLPLSAKIADVAMLEARLIKNARAGAVVHVIGRPGWFDAARWEAFNARRERLASEARARLVFWLDAASIALASRGAPDLWAWRGGVYGFVPAAVPVPALDVTATTFASDSHRALLPPQPVGADQRSMAERSHRVAEIRRWLARKPTPPDEMLVAPLNELGSLLFDLGDYDEAMQHWRQVVLPLHRALGDERAEAITQSKIADILQAQGQLDEALRIRKEEELPVFKRLGSLREEAIATGKIAEILQARGQLDEALRLYREEVQPVFERLDDLRSKAITLGHIADILRARGQFDEALRIHKEEELPVYKLLGDLHAQAATMGQIADILQARGQFDDALRVYKEELLPVFERLGNVRARAITMGWIADILQARGQLDEALRIRREEELPVYGRLGTMRERAITQAKIGLQLLDTGGATADEARALLQTAWSDLSRMGLPEADLVANQVRQRGLTPPLA